MDNMQQSYAPAKTLMPVIELFKKSFDAYWKKIWTLAGIILFEFLGGVILLPFIGIVFLISYGPFSRLDFNISLILIDILLVLIGTFFAIIFCLWARVALFYAVKEQGMNFKASLATAWPKLGSFFWISLLVGLAVLGGLILVIIPGIIFAVWFCFSMFVFVSEGIKGTSALKRSKQLVQGYWWPIFGRIVVLWIVAVLISWIKFFGPIIEIFIIAPFSIVFLYELYQDVKRVKS